MSEKRIPARPSVPLDYCRSAPSPYDLDQKFWEYALRFFARALYRARLILLALLLCPVVSAWAASSHRLEAPEDLQDLLERFLPDAQILPEDDPVSARLGVLRRVREKASELLATEGYFSPTISQEAGDPPIVRVEPGKRTLVVSLDIRFKGEISEDSRFEPSVERFRRRWGLKEGEPFREEDWAEAKESLLRRVQANHFAGARITESLAEIDPERAEAHLKIEIDSGPAYVLGTPRVEGLIDYPPELLDRYKLPASGEAYSLTRLQDFQSALQRTPYFSYVEVSADLEQAEGKVAPLSIRLQEAKPRRFGAGIGYSTNTGGRLDLSFRDANFFHRAWVLNSGLRLEKKQRAVFADVFLPPDMAGRQDSFGGIVETSHLNHLLIRRQALGVARLARRGDIEQRLGLSVQREASQADGAEISRKRALALDWQWTRRKLNNLIDPREGHILSLRLSGASRMLLSDSNFIRSWARLGLWMPLGSRRDVLSLKAEGGYTFAKSRRDVPQEFLFRTGGAQSVRGYDYLSLGVKEGEATVGGRYLLNGSAEYTHWFPSSSWGAAAFVDVGNAGDLLSEMRPRVGSGLGARWKSPAGPLALDLAYGWHDRRIRAHLSIALAF